MNTTKSLLLIPVLALFLFAGTQADDSLLVQLRGPYLGQTLHGDTAELFAPGIIPVEGIQHCFPSFSADGREVYWMNITRDDGRPRSTIWYMRATDSGWTTPATAPFSGKYFDQYPYIGPSNRRLYFSSNRPGGYGKARNIWYVERTDSGWGEPVNLGSPPNSDIGVTQFTMTRMGTAYFVGSMEGTQWKTGIYRSRFTDGRYLPPEPLPASIVTQHADVYPFIAPDESYLLFGSSRPGGKNTETDLYVTFRNDDGTWTGPVAFDERINNGKTVSFACVTTDNLYLFFNRFDDDGTDKFYWIDAKIIDEYRSKQ